MLLSKSLIGGENLFTENYHKSNVIVLLLLMFSDIVENIILLCRIVNYGESLFILICFHLLFSISLFFTFFIFQFPNIFFFCFFYFHYISSPFIFQFPKFFSLCFLFPLFSISFFNFPKFFIFVYFSFFFVFLYQPFSNK